MIGVRLVFDKFLNGTKANCQLLHAGDSKHFNLQGVSGSASPTMLRSMIKGIICACGGGERQGRGWNDRLRDAKGRLMLASVTTLTATGQPLCVRTG